MKIRKLFGKGFGFWLALTASLLANLVAGCAAVMLGRLYFVQGGSQQWFYALLQSGGWPILLPPLAVIYCFEKRHHHHQPVQPHRSNMIMGYKLKMLFYSAIVGLLLGVDNLLFSWGLSYLPVSTSSLLYSIQLAFNVLFAYMLVGQKLSSYIVNAVVIITTSAVLLGVQSSSDMPKGTTQRQYVLGFLATIAASALFALVLVLTELAYKKLGRRSAAMVMEFLIGTSIFATLFAVLGMWVGKTFHAISQEAAEFGLGRAVYWQTVVWIAICWQLYSLGSCGIILLASSLMSCAFTTATLPVVPILAVIFFHDSFSTVKGISAFLSIWGFLSYTYHGYLISKVPGEVLEPAQHTPETQLLAFSTYQERPQLNI